MNTEQIAQRLIELCRKADFETAQKELYAADATSIEPYETPAFAKETKGLDAILEKGRKFDDMLQELHSIDVSEPMIAGNAFAVVMTMDMTMKGKERMKMPELCVYEIKEGKIVSESFYV